MRTNLCNFKKWIRLEPKVLKYCTREHRMAQHRSWYQRIELRRETARLKNPYSAVDRIAIVRLT